MFNLFLTRFNIKGKNNKIVWLKKDTERNIYFKSPAFKLDISGNNNSVILTGKIRRKNLFKLLSGLKLTIKGDNNRVLIEFPNNFQNTWICISENNNLFSIKKTKFPVREATFFIEGNSDVIIGEGSQLKNRGLYVVLNGCYKQKHKLILGDNVYIAKDAIIRTSDGHTLIDLTTGKAFNEPKDIIIGNNVWITSRCTILKGTKLPDNSIVGACSLVNKEFREKNVLIAGSPARIIKKNIDWAIPDYGTYMKNLENKNEIS